MHRDNTRESTLTFLNSRERIRVLQGPDSQGLVEQAVAAPDGIALVERHHRDVPVYTPVVDSQLDSHKYIVPGLGDFGDRLYGTV